MVAILHIRLLGEFSLVYDDRPVTAVNTTRLQSLLAYLVTHRAAPQQRQHVAFVLWPGSSESQARTDLMHLLRQALPHADDFARADSATFQWRSDSLFRSSLFIVRLWLEDLGDGHGERAARCSKCSAVRRATFATERQWGRLWSK